MTIAQFAKKSVRLQVRYVDLIGDTDHLEYGIDEQFKRTAIEKALAKLEIQLPTTLSLEKLHDVANEISTLYRQAGLTFNVIRIKPQKVVNGVVNLSTTNGTLGDVQIYNEGIYPKEKLLAFFKPLMNKTVYGPELTATMRRIKKLSGIKLFSYYSRGRKSGEVRLNIRITEEKLKKRYIDLDNYGIEETGENRISYAETTNNLLGLGGQSNFIVTISDTADSLLGLAQYRLPNYDLDGDIRTQLASSRYEVAGQFESLELSGSMVSASMHLSPWQDLYDSPFNATKRLHSFIDTIGLTATYSTLSSDHEELASLDQQTTHLTFNISPRLGLIFSGDQWVNQSSINLELGHVVDTDERSVDDNF